MSICPSVRPSVCGKHDCVRTQRATDTLGSITHTLVGIENGLYRSTGSGTSHINPIGILGSWTLLYSNFKYHYQKFCSSVQRVWYLPYKSNRYIGVFSTMNVRFIPNLIFSLVCQLLITVPKIIRIGLPDPVPPI